MWHTFDMDKETKIFVGGVFGTAIIAIALIVFATELLNHANPTPPPIEMIQKTPDGVKVYRVYDHGYRTYFAVDKAGHVTTAVKP